MKNTERARAARAERPRPERTGRPDDANAFVPDTTGQGRSQPLADVESFAEEFIDAATRAGPVSLEAEDEIGSEEDGGPFLALDDEARLPPEPEEPEADRAGSEEGDEARGANWAARGV